MKSYAIVFILCILGIVSSQDARSSNKESTGSTGHSTVPKSSEMVSASNSSIHSSTISQKTPPGNTKVPKSSGKVQTSHPTSSSYHNSKPSISRGSSTSSDYKKPATQPTNSGQSRSTVPKSRGIVSSGQPKHNPTLSTSTSQKRPGNTGAPKVSGGKVPVSHPTTTTTSHQKPISPISRGFPPAGKIPKSSAPPIPIQTTVNSTTTPSHQPTGTSPKVVSASKTLSVSNGETVSASVGWIVVGVGAGGSVIVAGSTFPVEGGTEVTIEGNNSGQDEVVVISSDELTRPTQPETRTTQTRTTRTRTTRTRTTRTRTSTTSTTRRISKKPRSSSSSSSSLISTASPTPYNIYPRVGSTLAQQTAFSRHLEQIVQPGSVRSITGGRGKLLLWHAPLTPAQASELTRNPVVRGLNVDRPLPVEYLAAPSSASTSGSTSSSNCPPENCSRKRDGSVLMQQDAPEDLKVYSQARGEPFSSLPGYAYDARGGRGVTVYAIDSGINPSHPEFRSMLGNIRWLYLPGEPQIESDDFGHGSCVASKITGPTFGVAKSANIVVVKLYPVDGGLHVSRVIAAWGVLAADIASENLQGKAVVINAMGVRPVDLTESDKATYIEGLRDVIDLDAVVVTPSGNINAIVPGFGLALYPALLATEIGLPIIIVGAVDTAGFYAHYSQGLASELTVSAVGTVLCASHEGGIIRWSGTSFAAPAVAGLAAYLMSLDQYSARIQVPGSVARNVRNLIQSLAYERRRLQPAVVWNGINSREIYYCPVRRDAGSSECPARNTTSSTESTPITTVASSSSVVADLTTTVDSSSSIVTDLTNTVAYSSIVAEPSTTMSISPGESSTIEVITTVSMQARQT